MITLPGPFSNGIPSMIFAGMPFLSVMHAVHLALFLSMPATIVIIYAFFHKGNGLLIYLFGMAWMVSTGSILFVAGYWSANQHLLLLGLFVMLFAGFTTTSLMLSWGICIYLYRIEKP